MHGYRWIQLASISAVYAAKCYDISPCGISNQSGSDVPIPLKGVPLSGSVDPDHSHNGFNNMCDPDPITLACRNDGAWKTSSPADSSYAYVEDPVVTNSNGTTGHLLDPYITLPAQRHFAS
jgi:hypothetical protein